MAQDSADWNSDDDLDLQIDNYQSSPPSSPPPAVPSSGELFRSLIEMGFSHENIARAIEEHGPNADPLVIIDALSKYSVTCEASSSKSKTIDHFLAMGFEEEKVIKAIHVHGEDNIEEIANALISSTVSDAASTVSDAAKADSSPVIKEEEDIDWSESDDEKYAHFLSSDDERVLDSSPENGDKLRSLKNMGFSELEASLALERCGGDVSVGDLADFIYAAQIAREFDEFHADPEEQKQPTVKKRRIEPRREPRSSADDEPLRLPIPMIGFGVPNEPGLITQRDLPAMARRPPFFYYENVALAPKGVWDTISRHLYDIPPEFVDSKYICAAARKRGYVHNLPISGRYQVQPPPKYTISEAFPLTKKWWPAWDKRTKLNCILTVNASAQLTNRIRHALEAHSGEPPESAKKYVIDQCKKWNLVWVGKNKAAPLEPDEMETLLGFPRNHTRGGGMSRTERLKSLGNSFQVDTVAYHLSVLKPLFPYGINVLSLFTGIGGGEVALHRLQIPMKTVVSVEISAVNRNILKDFWEQTNQKGTLIEFADVQDLTNEKIVELMKKFGGFDLVIGGSPCNNLAGGNRVTRNGLEGDQSCLFFEYVRILDVVRETTKEMRRS
ncbi:hypothetical protein Bca4012_012096 [Brassica carinata]